MQRGSKFVPNGIFQAASKPEGGDAVGNFFEYGAGAVSAGVSSLAEDNDSIARFLGRIEAREPGMHHLFAVEILPGLGRSGFAARAAAPFKIYSWYSFATSMA